MSYRTGPGVPRSLTELWQFVRREFMSIERLYTRVETQAEEALTDLSVIADDGKLHPSEKLQVVLRYAQLTGEQSGLEAQATSYGITSEQTAYTSAIGALTTYLNGLTPTWTDATQVTPIDRSEWDAAWLDVTNARAALQEKISEVAGERAKWSQTEDDDGNKPEDGATVGATNAERALIKSLRNTFVEDFSAADTFAGWMLYSGLAESLGQAGGSIGGKSALLGDNSGNDMVGLYYEEPIPFDPAHLYRLELRVYKYDDTDPNRSFYLGLCGFDASGNLCNASGAQSTSGQHFVVANGHVPAQGWVTYVAYVKGNAVGNAVFSSVIGGNHIGNPAKLHANVRAFSPQLLVNFNAATGRTIVDYFKIDVIEVQDLRSLPMATSDLSGVPLSSVCTAVDAGSTATINVAAHTVQFGEYSVNYNSGSVAGLLFSKKYYVFCDDPGYAGGAVTYYATTNWATANAGNWRRRVDVITTPANGGGSSGGGVVDPEDCVASGMWLLDGLRVDDARTGDLIDVWDIGDDDCKPGAIEAIRPAADVDCVRLVMASGATVECSITTPVTGPDGEVRKAPAALGMQLGVLHNDDPLVWERVASVEPVGPRTVYHLSCGNISFAAGTDPAHRVITHNIYAKP